MTTVDELRESWKSFDNVLIYDMVSNHGNALSSTLYGLRTEAEKRGDYQQANRQRAKSLSTSSETGTTSDQARPRQRDSQPSPGKAATPRRLSRRRAQTHTQESATLTDLFSPFNLRLTQPPSQPPAKVRYRLEMR